MCANNSTQILSNSSCLITIIIIFIAFINCNNFFVSSQLIISNYSIENGNANNNYLKQTQLFNTSNNATSFTPTLLSAANKIAAGFLFSAIDAPNGLNLSDPIDANLSILLDKEGPDLRICREMKYFDENTLEVSKRAWRILHDRTLVAINERIDLARPAIEKLLDEAQISGSCRKSIDNVFIRAKQLDSWAIKLINSWGSFPPSGMYEGTYGEIGSYSSCVNIAQNDYIDHAHYCTITFRPILPKRADYELIINKEPEQLLTLFERNYSTNVGAKYKYDESANNDAFTDFLQDVQYQHLLYFKLGTCWPIKCSPFDIRKVTKLIIRKNVLENGPIKCYSRFSEDYDSIYHVEENKQDSALGNNISTSREQSLSTNEEKDKRKLLVSVWDVNEGIFIWKPHFYRSHWIAGSIILVLTLFIFLITLADIFINFIPKLWKKLVNIMKGTQKIAQRTNKSSIKHTNPFYEANIDSNNKIKAFDLCNSSLDSNNNNNGRGVIEAFQTIDLTNNETKTTTTTTANLGKKFKKIDHQTRRNDVSRFQALINDCSILNNTRAFFTVTNNQLKNEILCINGIRCITMLWVVTAHTMMFNDWSAFSRTREIEKAVKSLLTQPIFNGTYVVDTFFLMSGLLSAFTAFRHTHGVFKKFSASGFIMSRWLRLTPQLFFVSLIYIVIPTLSSGPHWYPMVGEFSENCIENWWVNVLHLQAFMKQDKMCNFVTWWISIDFSYQILSVAVIWIALYAGHRFGFASIFALLVGFVSYEGIRHYSLALPPNVLSTIPQTGTLWSVMILDFFWKPYSHAVPFFFGFYSGYLMSLKRKVVLKKLNTRRALIGWSIAVAGFLATSYSTYWWVIGAAGYSRIGSTIFFIFAPIVWSGSLCWVILACHHGYGGIINRFLSWKVFIILSKASYLIYLTHFMVLFLFFGNQNLLMEPTQVFMIYVILGNNIISTILGIFLCIVFEIPWLKAQRRIITSLIA